MTQSRNRRGRSTAHQELAGDSADWRSLLRREVPPLIDLNTSEYRGVLEGKCVLLTGAGGWIGSRLARRLANSNVRKLVLLDSSEGALYEIDRALLSAGGHVESVSVLANISDAAEIDEVFDQHSPDIVYHAGALKHVPLMELNPFAVIATNTLGTSLLVETALRYRCGQFTMVSTDKAADPASLMGASKRMAELVTLGMGTETLRTRVVRLGNVLGSSGSVVPLFLQQIAQGGPVTVSHPESRRFFMTTLEAVDVLLGALSPACPQGLLAAEMGDPIRIVDLANFLIAESAKTPAENQSTDQEKTKEISIAFTALRPGDKIAESLISRSETYTGEPVGRLRRVNTPVPHPGDLEERIVTLASAARRRNLGDLLQAVLQLVPEYRPTSLLLEQASAPSYAEVGR